MSTSYIDIKDKDTIQLRFAIGDRVECNCGEWKAGTIVKLFYTQRTFPVGKCAPYQVQLDDGRLIFAPMDVDRVVRKLLEVEDIADEEIAEADKLPVTVVTGFLGAGKTTLVNYILTEQHGKRICVIENEFGAVNIDTELVKENLQVAEEIISLDNGCACCTVRGDLMRALVQLKDRKHEFDLLLVETTGLANPAPVVATFTQDPTVYNHFRVDGIVCLVDCKFIKEHIDDVRKDDEVNEAVCQLAFADRVLMNKIDLVTKDELATLKKTIYSINSFAELVECERSRVPLEKIMDLNAFSIERINTALDEFEIEEEEVCTDANCTEDHAHAHGNGHASHEHGHAESHEHGHAESHDHGHADSSADCATCVEEKAVSHDHSHSGKPKKKHDLSGVGSIGLTADRPLIGEKFNFFMHDLLLHSARDLFRSKGVLAFKEEGNVKYIFQGVHEQIQYTTAKEPWSDNEPKHSKVVFIGRKLDSAALKKSWEECISKE